MFRPLVQQTRGTHLVQNLSGDDKRDLINQISAEHRAIKARIRELDRHISLTSAERVEYAQLKKLKLRAKDRIRVLEQN